MKRELLIAFVLALAGTSNAGVLMSVDGVVNPTEDIILTASETAIIDIHSDQSGTFWMILEYYGSIDVSSPTYLWEQSHVDKIPDIPPWTPSVVEIIIMDIIDTTEPITSPDGLVIDGLIFSSEQEGEAVLTLVNYDLSVLFDTQIISIVLQPDCFPEANPRWDDWDACGRPECWCAPPEGSGYQCDGDCDGQDSGPPFFYRVYTGDLECIIANWKKKCNDPTLNPCADFDHKDSGMPFEYRVYTADLNILVGNWRKKDPDLPGDCPRAE